MFVRTNILIYFNSMAKLRFVNCCTNKRIWWWWCWWCRFSKCSIRVKTTLFKSYCICMYDVALWKFFKKGSMDRFHSCYSKCVKAFFGYKRYDSLTKVLMNTGFPCFDNIIFNCKYVFEPRWFTSCNMLVSIFRSSIWWFTECVACYCVSFFMCLYSFVCYASYGPSAWN